MRSLARKKIMLPYFSNPELTQASAHVMFAMFKEA